MINIEQIRQLIEMMVTHDLVEISLRNGSEEVSLRRPTAVNASSHLPVAMHTLASTGNGPSALSGEAVATESDKRPEERLVEITSPMVGTFYAAPDADSPPFVEVGSTIQLGSVVCILEAMKVFNEIKSEVAGTIERILVRNAQTVEYGQPLFLVRPS